jgi:hypothetical protein
VSTRQQQLACWFGSTAPTIDVHRMASNGCEARWRLREANRRLCRRDPTRKTISKKAQKLQNTRVACAFLMRTPTSTPQKTQTTQNYPAITMTNEGIFLSATTSFQAIPAWAIAVAVLISGVVLWLFHWPHQPKIQPVRASKFRPELVPENIDTIVIGSGSGGCACSNLLAQSGQRVLVLEQHARTGGCTHSFRLENCEWDTGLHYTSMAMALKTCRPGALMSFMTKGLQKWTKLEDPYDEVVFPSDEIVKPGLPNKNSYSFVSGAEETVDSILRDIDPDNKVLRTRALAYMDLCSDINHGFTALGLSRILPFWLQFLVKTRVNRLMTFASMTVRDVQYAMLNLGYDKEQLLRKGCPKAPDGPESDPSLRRLKAVLTHPIGDYAVQPREATMAGKSSARAACICTSCTI